MSFDNDFFRAMRVKPCEFPELETELCERTVQVVGGYTMDGKPAVVIVEAELDRLIAANYRLRGTIAYRRTWAEWWWLPALVAFAAGILAARLGR